MHLTATDLDRAIAFYQDAIGLRLHRRDGDTATMGTGSDDLLVLVETPGARPAGRHAGLYHFALLQPSRLELARAVRRLLATGTPITGASDHGISEAIYLSDPDGNGIELAADRPPERWGDLRDPTTIGPRPLDMEGLLAMVGDEEPQRHADPGVVVGHVHLHVGDVERALEFYRDVLGFEVMTQFESAAFIAAGGYHHHLGLNTWRGRGVPPVPPDAVGLRRWTIVLPETGDVEAVRQRLAAAGHEPSAEGELAVHDPWGTEVTLVSAG